MNDNIVKRVNCRAENNWKNVLSILLQKKGKKKAKWYKSHYLCVVQVEWRFGPFCSGQVWQAYGGNFHAICLRKVCDLLTDNGGEGTMEKEEMSVGNILFGVKRIFGKG